jgi:hypothetical protein
VQQYLAVKLLSQAAKRFAGGLVGTSVWISMVTAILLWRSIHIATRGCTLRAASNKAQVRPTSRPTGDPCPFVGRLEDDQRMSRFDMSPAIWLDPARRPCNRSAIPEISLWKQL